MNKYKYTGTIEIELQGVGIVAPDQVIETKAVINHPLFEVVKEKPAKK